MPSQTCHPAVNLAFKLITCNSKIQDSFMKRPLFLYYVCPVKLFCDFLPFYHDSQHQMLSEFAGPFKTYILPQTRRLIPSTWPQPRAQTVTEPRLGDWNPPLSGTFLNWGCYFNDSSLNLYRRPFALVRSSSQVPLSSPANIPAAWGTLKPL